jgi:hypothetical protein
VSNGEAGQTAAEYAGALLVVALVVAALAAGGLAQGVAEGVEHAVCRIGGGDCEPADEPSPPVQRLAGGPDPAPPVAGHDIAILPFPGSFAVTCGYGEANEHACKPDGPGVRADATISADRTPTSLDGAGCPQQTVSLNATFQLERGREGSKGKATGRLGRYVGHSSSYAITAPPDQIGNMQQGRRDVPNPLDPRTLAPGESVQMSEAYYEGLGVSADYRALQASLGYDRGRRVSAGVQRVDRSTMRVHVGDEAFVRNALSLGVGGVSAGFGQEVADGKLRSIDIDVSTPEGWTAYQQFVTSGRLPGRGAAGTLAPTTATTRKLSRSASVEAKFGNVAVGGLLTDSEGSYVKTRNADGSIDHDLAVRHDDVGLSFRVEEGADGKESRSYALNLEGVRPDVYENFQALNFGDTRPPDGGNVRMDFTADELMGMRRQALEQVAHEMEQRGARPRPTPEEVAANLERNHGVIRYGPHGHEYTPEGAAAVLANAQDPEGVLEGLYRLANGDANEFLTGPMTDFVLRTNAAYGHTNPSERGKLPGTVGGPRCLA